MPATPKFGLRYPASTDSADVPRDIANLANDVETALGPGTAPVTGIQPGETQVWNGSAWARSTVTKLGITSLSGYPADATKYLNGSGNWTNVTTLAAGQTVSGANTDLAWPAANPGATAFLSITTSGGSLRSIGGPPAGIGQVLVVENATASGNVTVLNQVAGGTGAQLLTRNATNVVLGPRESMTFVWDGTQWRETVRERAILNEDVSATAAIAYTKLALTGSVTNSDIASGAAIAYSKLNLAGSVTNTDIAAGAAIAISKLAGYPASNSVFLRGDGTWSTVTTGVTSWQGAAGAARSGAVVATAGDYTAAMVTNAADLSASAAQTFSGPLIGTVFAGALGGAGTIASGTLALPAGGVEAIRVTTNDGSTLLNITGAQAPSQLLYLFNVSSTTITAGTTGTGSTRIRTAFTLAPGQGMFLTWESSGLWTPIGTVFGRAGAITAAAGDYTAAQVTNAADKASGSTQIFASALAVGTSPGPGPWSTSAATLAASGLLALYPGAAGNSILTSSVANSADTIARFSILGDGSLLWGTGAATRDTTLTRVAAGSLSLTGNLMTGFVTVAGASTATWTIDWTKGNVFHYDATSGAGGTITISSPNGTTTPPANTSTWLTLIIANKGTGTITLAPNAIFWGVTGLSVSAGNTITMWFVWDATKAKWCQLAGSNQNPN